MKGAYLIISIVLFFVSLFFSWMNLSEYYDVAIQNKIELYPFGGEGPVAGLWQYESAKNYATYSLILGALWTLITFSFIFTIIKRNTIFFRISIISAIMVYILGLILQYL